MKKLKPIKELTKEEKIKYWMPSEEQENRIQLMHKQSEAFFKRLYKSLKPIDK